MTDAPFPADAPRRPADATLRPPIEAARIALACLDLTALRGDEDDAALDALAERAAHPAGAPAALCVFAQHLGPLRERLVARGLAALPLATVVAFPHGDASPQRIEAEVGAAVRAGADEIDLVVPWRAVLAAARGLRLHGLDGDSAASAVTAAVAAARRACGGRRLKAIVESGELADPELVGHAAMLALQAGADFIKTSTGRARVHATVSGVDAILSSLVAWEHTADGRACGLKVSGGLRTVADVQVYLARVDAYRGPQAVCPERLRFGASGLWDALVAVIGDESTASVDPRSAPQRRVTPTTAAAVDLQVRDEPR